MRNAIQRAPKSSIGGAFLIGAGLGALAMYLTDPQNGRARRAAIRGTAVETVDGLVRDARSGAESAKSEFVQGTPAARSISGAVGAALVIAARFLGGVRGVVVGAIGSGLLARAAADKDLSELAPTASMPDGFDPSEQDAGRRYSTIRSPSTH